MAQSLCWFRDLGLRMGPGVARVGACQDLVSLDNGLTDCQLRLNIEYSEIAEGYRRKNWCKRVENWCGVVERPNDDPLQASRTLWRDSCLC
jgi:hypothetical protein